MPAPRHVLAVDAVRNAMTRHDLSVPFDLAQVADFVVELPPWVGAYGVAAAGGAWLLWVEPAGAESRHPSDDTDAFSVSQAVLDLPAGRYLVDIVDPGCAGDAAGGGAVSRESAAGPPLVIGLPPRRGALLVRISATHR